MIIHRRAAVALVLAAATVGCSSSNSPADNAASEYADRIEGASEPETMTGVSWESINDLTDADMVAIVNIIDVHAVEEKVRAIESDPRIFYEDFTFEIEDVIIGKASMDRYVVRTYGYEEQADGQRVEYVINGTKIEVGDRLLVALSNWQPDVARDSGLTGYLRTQDSALFLAGDDIIDTPRHKSVIRELEALTLKQATERIRALDTSGSSD